MPHVRDLKPPRVLARESVGDSAEIGIQRRPRSSHQVATAVERESWSSHAEGLVSTLRRTGTATQATQSGRGEYGRALSQLLTTVGAGCQRIPSQTISASDLAAAERGGRRRC